MDPNQESRLPLGLCRQAVMKLDSFIGDIHEILEEEDLMDHEIENFKKMAEIAGIMMANIVNTVSGEIGEEEFLAETPDMDPIDPWPGSDTPVEEMEIPDDDDEE